MKVWIIEPRDPLIVRDGRPFGITPGGRAVSLPFPYPSTTTGGVRTREGLDADGYFQTSEISRIKRIGVLGPLLVELDDRKGDISCWLVPAPSDALLLEAEPPNAGKIGLKQLVPLELPDEAALDFPDLCSNLVGMPNPVFAKPSSQAPRYWNWPFFMKWLINPGDENEIEIEQLGHDGPLPESRAHVAINEATQTSSEGNLFQTRGLEFTKSEQRMPGKRLALAVATEATNLSSGLSPLGGERRLVNWRSSEISLPSCPSEISELITRQKSCRVILLTPAYFQAGWKPSWLLSSREGIRPVLVAAAFGRPQVVSGWDLEIKRPKPTRRLAPPGTVYFLRFNHAGTEDIQKWINNTWMCTVSDHEQDRLDGFGLAVLGSWDGRCQDLEV